MSEFKTNKIKPVDPCSTTTLGESGDTIATGTGTTLDIQGTYSGINAISWDTTAKTADFTAETNRGYFVDTSSASVTVTLPASPVAGSFIGIKDYALTADTNAITIARNGNNIQGTASDVLIQTEGGVANLVYVDATQGWLTFDAAQASDITEGPTFITATGGTITTCGNFKIHTFTSPGTFCVSSIGNPNGGPNSVDYLVVAGGGGGGAGSCSTNIGTGAGGGAGGHRTSFPSCGAGSIAVTAQGYPITVGSGGTGSTFDRGGSGSNSVFSTITSAGGGGGGGNDTPNGIAGGSGGGGSKSGSGGAGNTPPVSPSQGNSGGNGGPSSASGGGGIGCAGSPAPGSNGGDGGNGTANSITGSSVKRAGGGGGRGSSGTGGSGGSGGGGDAGTGGPDGGDAGTANTGGGGGGGSFTPGAGAGSSGIVIIRYRYQ